MAKRAQKIGAKGLDDLVDVSIDGQNFARATITPENFRTNPELYGTYLTKIHRFLGESYKGDDVIDRSQFLFELQNPKNQNYTLDAILDPSTNRVVAAVAHGVGNVPVSPSDLSHDEGHQFTAVYYARARGKGKSAIAKKYEPALKWLLENVLKSGQEYSESKGMTNVGLLTADSRHKRVWNSLAQSYGGGYLPPEDGVGVPTLSEKVGKDYELNFKEHHKEKLVAITRVPWTKSMLTNIWAKELEEEYAHKLPGTEGYRPLATAQYFKDFAAAVQKLPGDNVTFIPIKV